MKLSNRTIWTLIPIAFGAAVCSIAAQAGQPPAAAAPVVQLPPDAELAPIHTAEAGPAVSLPDHDGIARAAPAAAPAAPPVGAAAPPVAAASPVVTAAPRIARAAPRVMMPTLTDPAVHTAEAGPVVSLPQK